MVTAVPGVPGVTAVPRVPWVTEVHGVTAGARMPWVTEVHGVTAGARMPWVTESLLILCFDGHVLRHGWCPVCVLIGPSLTVSLRSGVSWSSYWSSFGACL